MPCRKGQMELHALRPPDRDTKASRLAIEPIGLIFRLEHQSPHVWNGGSSPPFQPPAMGLQDRQGNLESGRDVLFVDRVTSAQILVGGTGESSPRSDVPP